MSEMDTNVAITGTGIGGIAQMADLRRGDLFINSAREVGRGWRLEAAGSTTPAWPAKESRTMG